MNQQERLDYLINYLLKEQEEYRSFFVPENIEDKKKMLRSLMNVRPPSPISLEFLKVQDEYLQQELASYEVAKLEQLKPIKEHIYLWQGDITKLQVDGIVNAANSALLGCFVPCHGCIDNAIPHSITQGFTWSSKTECCCI